MRQERTLRIKAFRRALELGAGERADGCRHFPRWKEELRNFPHGSCDLASNTLAKYLTDTEGCHPCIIFMEGNAGFQEAENSTVHGHVIVLLDGEYIDLTLDQFPEYPEYIPAEAVESGGPLGKLLRNIMKHEDPVKTRRVDRKRAARTVLTGMCYSVGSATRQGSSSLTRFIGQSAITSSTWRR